MRTGEENLTPPQENDGGNLNSAIVIRYNATVHRAVPSKDDGRGFIGKLGRLSELWELKKLPIILL